MNLLTLNTPNFAHFFMELRDFWVVGSARCKVKNVL
jgi:hypothetical protein